MLMLQPKRRRASLLKRIVNHNLQSGDFNGLPFLNLMIESKRSPKLGKDIEALIRERKVDALFHDQQVNAHIKRLPEEPPDAQLEKLESQIGSAVLYPTTNSLKAVIDQSEYAGKPFTLRMALGEPQLAFQPFDLSVLEFYRNDPRYHYDHDDITGKISITSEYFESEDFPEHDQILLQSFGFCFDTDLNRSVAVFLRDLSDLSPQHQQIWGSKTASRRIQASSRLLSLFHHRRLVCGSIGF